ncbi:PSP1, C-terminal [Kalmanozyma brasiliensis GHG001]|uniref:PSP1, C-terminal n=1 Tax=Kalmanozyma brasiliensis (strain GHG001) TaxID=1365824 RepID=UPI001CE9B3FC|nr:PSP1, C-terminal [Kalmanozyma brasiliensis GHG001]EST08326.2 PSP1, C-terminal [Kalmanozyma brasiliensis GHG001]
MTSNGHRDYTGQTVNDQRAWPRAVSHGRDRSVSSVLPGFNPFAGGSLALSVDDLAADREYDATARDSAATARNASSAGAHEASSMPSDFYDRGVESFDTRSRGFTDASQPRNHRGGRDSLSVSWDAMTPSHAVAQSPGDGQRTLAEMTRQLRQMSMGGGELQMRSQPSGVASIFDSQEGTRTVRASPGTSPTGIRGSSSATPSMGHGLSAQAKAFTASQPLGRMSQDQLGSTGYAGVGPGDMPTYGFPTPLPTASSGFVPPMASAPPFIPAQHQLNFGASAVGLPAPAPSAAAMASALALSNDLTFSSLAALGPMPPSSMGPPLPMGGIGGAPFGAGTTSELQDLGKGVPLTSLSKDTPLYIVEFKQGRTDLFFRSKSPPHSPTVRDQDAIRRGDLVIVEADRGKDLGTVVNDSITVEQVQAFLAHQSDLTIGAATSGAASVHGPTGLLTGAGSGDETSSSASGLSASPSSTTNATHGQLGSGGMGARPMRTISPKRLFTKATAADTSTLFSKAQDEERALQLCISKVVQRGLPMSVVAAEMQWDRRKLTFYYTASMRVDFRDLVKELFRLYKTRIWMCHLGHPSGAGV